MRKEFTVHLLNEAGIELAQKMAEKYSELADWIEQCLAVGSPEATIAFRKLEESCFYAKKSLAQIGRFQVELGSRINR